MRWYSVAYAGGMYIRRWGSAAKVNASGQWKICNHECGSVTAEQGRAWNAGKAKVLKAATEYVGAGPYFSNGDFFEGVEANLNGLLYIYLSLLASHNRGFPDGAGYNACDNP